MSTLYLPASVRRQLESWVESGYPYETCGVLVGRQEANQIHVERAVLARNLNQERAHDRYELSSEDFVAADQAARADGLEIIGIWHSHPDHPARPSETDSERAWQDWSYLILSVQRGQTADVRSWRLANEAFEEETLTLWQP